MDLKHPKWAMLFLCALLALMGCENPTDDNDDDDTTTADELTLTLVGAYGVKHPNDDGSQTNYIVLAVEKGDYTKGTYALGETTVKPTPVLTDGDKTTLVKLEAPGGATKFTLAVTNSGTSVLEKTGTFSAAGAAPPGVLFGETPMTFSEFFHDITANIAEIEPSSTAFSATGSIAVPAKFITAGTRTGNSSAGVANGTPKWTDTDKGDKVDVISSATYGDNPHFVPTGNLDINYDDPMTKADNHEVTGIKAVEVGVDFDLYANADLLRQANKATTTSTAVLANLEGITWKAPTEVYKAKYLRPDASWGRRDQTARNEAKGKAWPKDIGGTGGATVNVSYGGTWADKVISVDFAPLTAPLDSQTLWNDYYEYVYAGYVEDLQKGHKEPLVWLQNLFSHRGHTNLEAALNRAGISRMLNLSPAGKLKLVIFARGFKDIIAEVEVKAYDGQSSASIEQGSTFYKGANPVLLNSAGNVLEEGNKLHITGLSAAALADFGKNGGSLLKGTAVVPEANRELNYLESDGEIEIVLKDGFFSGAFQGSYSLSITSDAVYKTPAFAVNRIIERPTLQQGTGTASAADSATSPITVTKAGGNIVFSNEDFAKAIIMSGRSPSSITPAVTGGITAVLKAPSPGAAYQIDPSALSAGDYTLTILVSNFAKSDRTNISPVTYHIKVE
jgi:hypothetical protein